MASDVASPGSTTEEETVIKTGEVICNRKAHRLTLRENGLTLVGRVQLKTGGTVDKEVLELSWRDVVCASEAPVKKSKSTPETEAPARQSKIFVLHYIDRVSPKSKKLCCRNVQVELSDGTSETWIFLIEEKRKLGKPEKLLVVINPIGGKGNARQMFRKQVHPLFALAGIETVVKMTERSKHALEIGKTFDISTVDGVVVVGGDGLYAELLHAFVLRAQEEAGADVNDPEAKLVPPRVRMGIVPAGTGNGLSNWLNDGVVDVDTATLNIIRGETNSTGIFSVHEPGKLVCYCGLQVASGWFSTVIKRTEELRWMKRARYPYAMLTTLLRKNPVMDVEIEVLYKSPPQAAGNMEASGHASVTEDAKAGWTKLGVKHVNATNAFLAQIIDGDNDRVIFNPFSNCFDLWLLSPAGGVDYAKFLIGLIQAKKSAMEQEFIEWCHDIVGYRMRVVEEKAKEEGAASSANSALGRLLNIDGELITCSVPQFDVRMHSNFIQVFSVNNYKT